VEVLGDGELGGGQLVGLDRDLLEVGEVAGPLRRRARRAVRRSTRRSARPATTEAMAAPATRTISHAGRGPGMANRNATDPPLPTSGTRYWSQPARLDAAQPTVGGAATVRSIAGSGRGYARTGRWTRNLAEGIVEVDMAGRYDPDPAVGAAKAKLWITPRRFPLRGA
jgi:hypothetical protein